MKSISIANLISTIAEAQHLVEAQDELSLLVLRYAPKESSELGLDDLQFVSAARLQNYDDFIKRLETYSAGGQRK